MRDLKLAFNRVFIVGGKDQTEEDWQKTFGHIGQIHQVLISKDRDTGRKKGITYIRFEKTSEACRAVEEMTGQYIGNDRVGIKVIIATDKHLNLVGKEDTKTFLRRICVRIPKTCRVEEIKREFRQYGKIGYAFIPRGPNTPNKGKAIIKFEAQSGAARAMEECDDKYDPIWIDVMSLNEKRHERYLHPDEYPPQDPCPASMGGPPEEPVMGSMDEPFMDEPFMEGPGGMPMRAPMAGPMGGFMDEMDPQDSMGGPMGGMSRPMGGMSGPMGRMGGPMRGMGGSMGGPMETMGDSFGNNGVMGKQKESSGLGMCELEAMLPSGMTPSQAYALFDIAQGMQSCIHDIKTGLINAVYNNEANATHAREKINGMDYAGQKICVRYKVEGGIDGIKETAEQLQYQLKTMMSTGTANAKELGRLVAQLSKVNDIITAQTEAMEVADGSEGGETVAFCSVPLPPIKEKVPPTSPVVERLMFKLSGPVPQSVVEDVFCRFGNLVRCLVNEQNTGYAHFSDKDSAALCTETLNMARIMNVRIMFTEPEDPAAMMRQFQRPGFGKMQGGAQGFGKMQGGAQGFGKMQGGAQGFGNQGLGKPLGKRQPVGYPDPSMYMKQSSGGNYGFQQNTGFQQTSQGRAKKGRFS